MELQVSKCLKLRAHLKKSLKDEFPGYIAAILEWIRMRKSRAELDSQVLSILEEPIRKAHTDFLASLSKLCWGISSLRIETSIPTATGSRTQDETERLKAPQGTKDSCALFRKTYADLSLPGIELIRARLYLAAWDAGLSNVDSKVGRLLQIAMKQYVKDIIQTAFTDKVASTVHSPKTAQGLSVWRTLMRTNCDRPTVQYSSSFDQGVRDPVKTL